MRKPRASSDPRARAKVWTPERIAAVCELVAEGTFVAHACAECGGSYTGLWDVMQADPDVRQQIDAARAKGVRVLRERLDTATTDWKREAWLLERYDREAFAPPKATVESKSEITGAAGSPIAIVVTEAEMLAAASRKVDDE